MKKNIVEIIDKQLKFFPQIQTIALEKNDFDALLKSMNKSMQEYYKGKSEFPYKFLQVKRIG
jgi:hypothetical protein